MRFSKRLGSALFDACLILSVIGFAQAAAFSQAHQFAHPGISWSLDDLDKLAGHTVISPWSGGWNKMVNSTPGSLSYVMRGPFTEGANKGINQSEHTSDAQASLYHAFQYHVTGNEAHAILATQIVDSWATTHTTWSGTSVHLHAAWRGGMMVQAAEILRYTYPGWTAQNTINCETYFENILYPLFRLPDPLRAANQGANNLWGAVQVAIFLNDQQKFQDCLDAYLIDPCAGISNSLPNGQCGDTGRDQGHAGAMIGNLGAVAQIFFVQGIDVYGVLDNRLLKMMEYWCQYNSGEDVEFIDHGTCYGYYTSIGADGRDPVAPHFVSVMEGVRAAYFIRKGVPAPHTLDYLAGIDPEIDTFFHRRSQIFTNTASPSEEPYSPFMHKDVSSLTSTEIGSASQQGNSNFSNGTWTVNGSGNGLNEGSNTSYHYAYTQLSGDGEMIARVQSIENTNADAGAALVLRTSLSDPQGDNASIAARPTEGSQFSSRGIDAGDGNGSQTFPLSNLPDGPVWLRLERRGNRVVGYVGPDGVTWAPMQHIVFDDLPNDVFIGLASTSSSNNQLATAVFSDVQLTPQLELNVVDSYSNDPPTVSSNDLAQTAFLSSSAVGGSELLAEQGQLINGLIGNMDGGSGDSGEVRVDRDNSFTINFDTITRPQGYDISEINSIFGWNTAADGRSNQGYGIRFDLVDGSSRSIAPGHWAPNSPAFFWTSVSMTEVSGGMIATGVESITFTITERANAGTFVVAREFDIFGSPSGQPAVLLGDFNADGVVNCDDLNGYVGNIGAAAAGPLAALDVDGDGTLSSADANTHITTLVVTTNGVAGTFPGDLNCDGTVNVLGDPFALISNLNNAATMYSEGDINFDGTVNVLGDAFALIGNLGNSN